MAKAILKEKPGSSAAAAKDMEMAASIIQDTIEDDPAMNEPTCDDQAPPQSNLIEEERINQASDKTVEAEVAQDAVVVTA